MNDIDNWLIAYGIGSAFATVLVGGVVGSDFENIHWHRVILWVFCWPILFLIFVLMTAGHLIREAL